MLQRAKKRMRAMIVLAAACGGSPAEPPPVEDLSEIRLPPPIGPSNFNDGFGMQSRFVWAPDGQTIYHLTGYSAMMGFVVAEFNLVTRETRMIACCNSSFQVIRITEDGEYLFYSSQVSDSNVGYTITRLSTMTGESEVLVEGARHLFGISPDGRLLAWSPFATNVIHVRDLSTGTTLSVEATEPPLLVSPDYTSVLHGFALGSVSETLLATSTRSGLNGNVRDARWGSQGWELAIAELTTVKVGRGLSATPITLWTAPTGFRVSEISWSWDGALLAVTAEEFCFKTHCRWQLVIIDADTGTTRTVVDRVGPDLGPPHFSPDGKWVAVVSNSRLHLVPVP